MVDLKKAVGAGFGLLSFAPMRRISSLETILSFLLHKLPRDVRDSHFHIAPRLSDEHMPNAKLYSARAAMLHALPKGGKVAEVGTWRGDFSKKIAEVCQPAEFHLIDIDFSPLDENGVRSLLAGGVLHKHQGDSSKILVQFPELYFDWLYVDGDHTYEGVRNDLAAAHSRLKPGGYLMCNDYTNWDLTSAQPYGVAKAVNELCLSHNYEVYGLALEGAGYHDILLRKPT
jgi:hypothetical protein